VGNPLPTLKVYPPDNPLAVMVCVYATPIVPAVSGLDGDSVVVGQLIVTFLLALSPVQPDVSVARTVNVYAPDAVGVPDSTPVVGAKLKPVGSEPVCTVKVYEPFAPLAVNVVLL
jgi:hypothetical protein